jgi:hypothetical protein
VNNSNNDKCTAVIVTVSQLVRDASDAVRYELENTDLDGRIILRLFLRKYEGVVDWLDLAQDRDRLRALETHK